MKKIIRKEPNHLTKKAEQQFVARILQEAGFPKGIRAYVRDQHGKLIVRFTKNSNYE
jgi:hypothetical protein